MEHEETIIEACERLALETVRLIKEKAASGDRWYMAVNRSMNALGNINRYRQMGGGEYEIARFWAEYEQAAFAKFLLCIDPRVEIPRDERESEIAGYADLVLNRDIQLGGPWVMA